MIIYEVTLSVETDIYAAFHLWIMELVQEVVSFKGFTAARILEPIEIDNPETEGNITQLVLQYELERYEDLLDYFELHSQRMRKEAMQRFGQQFRISRRIYKESCNFVSRTTPCLESETEIS